MLFNVGVSPVKFFSALGENVTQHLVHLLLLAEQSLLVNCRDTTIIVAFLLFSETVGV